jgi:REP element-mobilizing transposase RayT
MATLFQNRYRVGSTRHPAWNYADSGMYFVTICAEDRICYFGDIFNEEMHLNNSGRIAGQFWLEIPKHFPNVVLDEYVIMPNHIHGVIFIDNDGVQQNRRDETMPRLYTGYTGEHPHMSEISPQPGSLSVIVGSFKSACTKQIRLTIPRFAWQSRFYDHIIRNERELHDIRNYIYYNPAKWSIDRNHVENLYM